MGLRTRGHTRRVNISRAVSPLQHLCFGVSVYPSDIRDCIDRAEVLIAGGNGLNGHSNRDGHGQASDLSQS